MPRGQKSKVRAREKRRQTRKEPEDLVSDQATIGEKDDYAYSSSAHFKGIPHGSLAETLGNPQDPGRTPSTTITTAAVSFTKSVESINNKVKEGARSTEGPMATENFPRGHLDEKVVMLVHYLLYKYQMKEPITKAEILKNVIQIHKNHFPEILKRVSEHLELVFGLDLKEVDPNRHIYVLINKLEPSSDARLSDDRNVPKTGLLMTILAVIFTKGNCASEQQVWEMLNMMGLYDGKEHFIFGDPKKLITKDLVKEKYLEYRQVANSDPPCYEFLWGPRAHAETSKMKVLEFLAKIHDSVPTAFPSCYEEALRDEEERAQAKAAAKFRISALANARSKATSGSFSHP
ncbi:Melanoma-associated antigen B10 [Sciurus carolinensis]|uniref:Melanoma-associated antigen B10 n=1 Tax=Sciurus carolinensis TaxID=30640 RepID=A0AA41NED4_SCICA|nr:Melanoma-associated antigen B10 [Sciurus carolinensis]